MQRPSKAIGNKTLVSIFVRNIEIAFRRWFGLSPRPYKLLLELTEYCNSRCQTCDIWKVKEEPKTHLTVENAENLLRDFGNHTLWLALSGGEITLYKNFPELVSLIDKYCRYLKVITFTTNGLLPERALDCALQLKKLGTDIFVTISLDGDEKSHDDIRGVPGNFKKTFHTYNLLKSYDVPVHWGLTVSDLNKSFIESDDPLLNEIKAVTFVHSDGIYKKENTFSEANLLAKVSEKYKISNLSEAFEWFYLRLSWTFLKRDKKIPVPCEVIATSLHVRPNGDIHPCMFVNPIGTIERDKITDVLKLPFVKTKMTQYRKGQCPGCWMNCYAPHSMMQHPWRSLFYTFVPWMTDFVATKKWRNKITAFMISIRNIFDTSEI